MGLILSIGFYNPTTTLTAADQPAVSPSKPTENEPLPIYTPPKKLTPRARVGGGFRGTDGKELEIVALVPDHVGLTVKQAPSLNWFLSEPTSLPIRFTLIDNRSVKPLHEGTIPTPGQVGVQSLDLKELGLELESDVQYRWYISAIRDPNSPSKDIVAGGVIERCEFSACLIEIGTDLSCDQSSVTRNAKSGLWYDAMSCLCDLIKTNQQDASLRRMRAALLKQVGLNSVAEWDLKSAPPDK
ncbi:hypothetical protein AYO43_01785 [Nitrospira sp. SCGC AG-212-E16]|nr:hypothetical protein AYO43_01785 [Nitrospira sp. SCGC AG-212-E16]